MLLELNYSALKEMGISSVAERAKIKQAVKKLQAIHHQRNQPINKLIHQQPYNTSLEEYGVKENQSSRFLFDSILKPREKNEKEKKQEQDLYALFGVSLPQSDLANEKTIRNQFSGIQPRTSSIVISEHKNDNSEMTSPYLSPNIKKHRNEDQDIMDINDVRSKCIRVQGIHDNQTHVINVATLNDAAQIRKKIYLKFNIINGIESADLLIVDPEDKSRCKYKNTDFLVHVLEDNELLLICTDKWDENRGNIFIRKVDPATRQFDGILSPLDVGRRKKIQNFFGDTPTGRVTFERSCSNSGSKERASPMKTSPIERIATKNNNTGIHQPSRKTNILRAFFGER